jgi:hypothetical protein
MEKEFENGVQEIVLPGVFEVVIDSIHSFIVENGQKMFFVKLRRMSFKKCRWMSEDEILLIDPSAKGKLSRFIKEKYQGLEKKIPEYFNFDSAYQEVD